MPIQVKACACGTDQWISMMSHRIESLGYEEILWCKECGTIKKISIPNGSNRERTLDYRKPRSYEIRESLKVIK